MRGWIWAGGVAAVVTGAGYAIAVSMAPYSVGVTIDNTMYTSADGWRILRLFWWQTLLVGIVPAGLIAVIAGAFVMANEKRALLEQIEVTKAKAEEEISEKKAWIEREFERIERREGEIGALEASKLQAIRENDEKVAKIKSWAKAELQKATEAARAAEVERDEAKALAARTFCAAERIKRKVAKQQSSQQAQ